MSLPIENDLFYECRSGQHETCIRWLHSASPNPPTEIRCSCRCHGGEPVAKTSTTDLEIQKSMSREFQERLAELPPGS